MALPAALPDMLATLLRGIAHVINSHADTGLATEPLDGLLRARRGNELAACAGLLVVDPEEARACLPPHATSIEDTH